MLTAADMNRITYLGAAKLKAEMSRPGGQPEKLDFSIMAGCFNCDRVMSQHTGQKVLSLIITYVAYLLVVNSRLSVRDASPSFTAPERYVPVLGNRSRRGQLMATVPNRELENRAIWLGWSQTFLRKKQGG